MCLIRVVPGSLLLSSWDFQLEAPLTPHDKASRPCLAPSPARSTPRSTLPSPVYIAHIIAKQPGPSPPQEPQALDASRSPRSAASRCRRGHLKSTPRSGPSRAPILTVAALQAPFHATWLRPGGIFCSASSRASPKHSRCISFAICAPLRLDS